MFDIGFSELLLIGVVALVVIGPERLPKVARTVGAWLGRLNRYVSEVKGDIDREMRLDELRKMQREMKDSVQKYEILADETGREIKREAEGVEKVMQAMAATDGGLAMQAYEQAKEEGKGTMEEPSSDPSPFDDQGLSAMTEASQPSTTPREGTQTEPASDTRLPNTLDQPAKPV